MELKLPQLPYPKNAFVPYISSETMEFHYEKHHQAYLTKFNELIRGTPFEEMSLIDIILCSSGPLFHNPAQHWNHTFFWDCLRPAGGSAPSQKIVDLLSESFGGVEEFKVKFTQAALANFGSGWTWLVHNEDGSLEIMNTANADSPLRHEKYPLLTLDVWEHAYYIDYRNSRQDFIDAFWHLANWEFAEANHSMNKSQWAGPPSEAKRPPSSRLPH